MSITAILFSTAIAVGTPQPQTPAIKTLLLTGENNHNWRFTSRLHADTLEASGRFAVTITDNPAEALADAALVAGYQLFVVDYNDIGQPKRWGEAAEKNFAAAVAAGAGVAAIHSANNAFAGWESYERMVGICWRENAGHGPFHPFDVIYKDRSHPITTGLPDMHQHPDELYHRLTNVHNVPYTLLAAAVSATDKGGTGNEEPMALTLQFGKGRIFHTPLGHVWTGAHDQKTSICDPQFKALLCRGAEWAATGAVSLPATWADTRTHNALPSAGAEGWTLLFDGKTTTGWRGYKQDAFPTVGWSVKDGTLHHQAGAAGGDIITSAQYADFEFSCDWRIAPKGNSGIIYRITEDHDSPWETGPEMQVLDDAVSGGVNRNSAGALYDLVAPAYDVARPAGEWNTARIVVNGAKTELWLNGFKIVDADTASEEYRKAHAASKWTHHPDFGSRATGHIALQDHADEVAYRNLRIRQIK